MMRVFAHFCWVRKEPNCRPLLVLVVNLFGQNIKAIASTTLNYLFSLQFLQSTKQREKKRRLLSIFCELDAIAFTEKREREH